MYPGSQYYNPVSILKGVQKEREFLVTGHTGLQGIDLQ